ncbi:hypothetical protein I79_016178 [Cricetulus griseus]|uniref:Uncharacterized protein n=1 Tax=Cricetulus griseus TaxID=10029 RepID=G3HYN7_CRIGR|nr:hypothetical protein I79_016178 [Cricetulus griseus]
MATVALCKRSQPKGAHVAPPLLVALHGGRGQLAALLAALAHFLHTLPPALFVPATARGEVHIILLFQVMGNRLPSGQGIVRGTHFGPITSPFDLGAWLGSQLTPASL